MIVNTKDVAREIFRNSGSFIGLIVRAWQKADPNNQRRLREAFPEIIEVCEEWRSTPTEAEFFELHGVIGEEL